MGEAKPVTQDGRARLDSAMAELGMLLIRGQHELPSIADLLEGEPITTRGYSWDYVPAWNATDAYLAAGDHDSLKLWKGMSTVVERRWWPALDAVATRNVERALGGAYSADVRAFVGAIQSEPGIPGAALKERLGWSHGTGTRRFQRTKAAAEQRLLVVPLAQESDVHTHDSAWHPWTAGRVHGASSNDAPSPETATERLADFAATRGVARPGSAFPCLRP